MSRKNQGCIPNEFASLFPMKLLRSFLTLLVVREMFTSILSFFLLAKPGFLDVEVFHVHLRDPLEDLFCKRADSGILNQLRLMVCQAPQNIEVRRELDRSLTHQSGLKLFAS